MNAIHRKCSNGLTAKAKSSSIEVGHIALEEALPFPDDWEKGWMLSWVGRRCSIVEDIQSGKVTNMSGHMCLITNKAEIVTYLPDFKCSKPLSENYSFNVYAKKVVSKDRTWLERWNLPGKITTTGTSEILHAVEAGIDIQKYQVLYSPSRLREILSSPHLVGSCRYAWNIDITKRHLNCNTFFQAWHITKDLPWAHKMSDVHKQTSVLFNHIPMSWAEKQAFKLSTLHKQTCMLLNHISLSWAEKQAFKLSHHAKSATEKSKHLVSKL